MLPTFVSWLDPAHRGCVVCSSSVHRRQELNLQRIRRVAAASLRVSSARTREGGRTKQETPDPARSEVSTAHSLSPQEARAAGAQSDTRKR